MHTGTLFFLFTLVHVVRQVNSQVRTSLFKDMKYVVDKLAELPVGWTPCEYSVTDESVQALRQLIHENKRSLVYMTLNFPDGVIFPETSYQEILRMDRWIWIRKGEGLELLKVDFRFEFYSLGILSTDVGFVTLNFTAKCNLRSNGMQIDSLQQMMFVLQQSLGYYISTNSSLCYHKLAKSTKDQYYTQPYCCTFDQMSPECGHFIGIYTSGWFTITLYVFVFSLSPLLLASFFTKQKEIYILEPNGTLRRKKSLVHKRLESLNLKHNDQVEEVEFPNYIKKRNKTTQHNELDSTPSTSKSTAAKTDSHFNEHTVQTEPLCSEPSTLSPIETEVNSGVQYITYNKHTPVRITHPFKFLLLLNVDNLVIGVIRRLLFFVLLYPAVIYVYWIVVHFMYNDHIMFLIDVETKMNITGQLMELLFFDHLYAGNFFSNPRYIFWSICMVAYGVTAVIFSSGVPLYMLTERLALDDGYMGFIKLPYNLRQKTIYDQGTRKIQRKMAHRLSLIVNPKFWRFWFKELVALFRCREQCGLKESMIRILLFFGYIISLLNFLPLTNCLLFDMIVRNVRKPEDSETRRLVRTYGRRKLAKLLAIMIVLVVIVWGMIFAVYIFMESSRIVVIIIIYSVRGAVKNYLQVMPILSIIAAGWYFLKTTLGNVENRYLYYKKIIFDVCLQEHERLESKCEANEKIETHTYPLVIYRRDGIPLIPHDLYYNVLFRLFPLSKHELPAIGQLLITAGFLYLIATTIDVFSKNSIANLGEALTTLLAATLPNLLQAVFKYEQDAITTDRHVFKVEAEIRRAYSLQKQLTSVVKEAEAEPAAQVLDIELQEVDEKESLREGEAESSL